ncbi:MAG: SHOCT domain-containing protein [Firmicutes bacterium]|nr:SHOCT domain-containing protein [Bacillota bacterium]
MDKRSDVERIREYKELLDEGMITQEEFEAKKKKIVEEDEQPAGGSFIGGEGKPAGEKLSPKVTNVLSYITFIGFLIAYFAGDREHCMFHLNQGLVLNLFGLLMGIPLIGWVARIGYIILMIVGIVNASSDVEKPLPLIGTVKLM